MNTRIADAHHHIWLRDRTPWPAGPMVPRIFGEYQGIRRDYLIEVRDYLLKEYADDGRSHGLTVATRTRPYGTVTPLAAATMTWQCDLRGHAHALAGVSYAGRGLPRAGQVESRVGEGHITSRR